MARLTEFSIFQLFQLQEQQTKFLDCQKVLIDYIKSFPEERQKLLAGEILPSTTPWRSIMVVVTLVFKPLRILIVFLFLKQKKLKAFNIRCFIFSQDKEKKEQIVAISS